MAAQFIFTKGWARRGDSSWIARAISSLPVPFSPRMRMAASAPATRSTRSRTAAMAEESPMSASSSCQKRFSSSFSRWRRSSWSALRRVRSRRSSPTGFSTKSSAPRRVALTAVSRDACPLIRITGIWGAFSRAAARNWSPSISGMTTSERIASTGSSSSRSSARVAEEAVIAV